MKPALRARLRGATCIALSVTIGAAAAVPAGWVLGTWVIFGAGDFTQQLALYWTALPLAGLAMMAAATAARTARGAVAVAVPVLIFALLLVGAWNGVSTRIEAFRAGPLDAAL